MSFEVQNGTNREWTTSEEADLSAGYALETPGIQCHVYDDFAVVRGANLFPSVHLWAIGDNLYVACLRTMKGSSNKIYWSNSLKDAFDFAAEAINLS